MLLKAFPFFCAVQTGNFLMVLLVLILTCNVGRHLCYSVERAYFAEFFEPKLRYSGASVGPQVAAVFAGGFARLIATALIRSSTAPGSSTSTWWAPETAPRVRLRKGQSAEYDPTTAR